MESIRITSSLDLPQEKKSGTSGASLDERLPK